MIQGPRPVLFGELRQDVSAAGQHTHRPTPALCRVCHTELRADLQWGAIGGTRRLQAKDRLGDDETDVVLQPLLQTRGPMLHRVARGRRRIYPHPIANEGHGEGPHVVGEWVKGTPAREVETRMVPMAGQNAVFDRTSVQWESHMRAAIIDGIHLTAVVEHGDGMAFTGDDHAPSLLQRLEGVYSDEPLNRS